MGNIVKRYGEKNVVEAAKTRIKNVFDNNLPVYMSFSGGKDSICMADLVYKGVVNGSLDANLLKVVYIDEEAIYPGIEQSIREWRQKFLNVGATFLWFCLEVKHY